MHVFWGSVAVYGPMPRYASVGFAPLGGAGDVLWCMGLRVAVSGCRRCCCVVWPSPWLLFFVLWLLLLWLSMWRLPLMLWRLLFLSSLPALLWLLVLVPLLLPRTVYLPS